MNNHQTPSISIVVACRNERGHIRALVESILAQNWGEFSWEALIADGMSDDGTREILADYCREHSNLKMIDNARRVVSCGLNAAILQASGKYVIRMDAHTSYAPDYCVRCVDTLEATGADNVGGPARTKTRGLIGRAVAAAYHSRFSTGGARFHDVDYEGWADTVPYGCWRRTTLLELGLFDENFVRNQDDELNLRLLRKGGRIWQTPKIVSWYQPRQTLSSLFLQYFQYGFWKVAVIRKHHIPGSWRHLVPVSMALATILIPIAMIAALIAGSRALGHMLGAIGLALFFAYAAASAIASVLAARRHGWALMKCLPLVFATYHFSYGFGFLRGLLFYANGNSLNDPVNSGVVRLTR